MLLVVIVKGITRLVIIMQLIRLASASAKRPSRRRDSHGTTDEPLPAPLMSRPPRARDSNEALRDEKRRGAYDIEVSCRCRKRKPS